MSRSDWEKKPGKASKTQHEDIERIAVVEVAGCGVKYATRHRLFAVVVVTREKSRFGRRKGLSFEALLNQGNQEDTKKGKRRSALLTSTMRMNFTPP